MSLAASSDSQRAEARWARQQGWGVRVDTAYSQSEWRHAAKDDLFYEECEDATGFKATGRPGMVELFAGSGTLAEAFRLGAPTWVE
eukprot:3682551-Pyramimonas_sp.AAC.1